MDKACEFYGAQFWIEERIGGSVRQPAYSKCCDGGKVAIPRICTPLDFLGMLRDVQNGELRKNIRLYNVAFAFTSTRVQSVSFELGPGNRQLRNPNLSQVTLMAIRDILGRYNPYVRVFERVADRLAAHPAEEVRVVLTATRNHGSDMDPP
ncbi:unnamed protein product [Sphagnum jensenii]|uniref:Uncharacterized protein n=1 Tax=Sphagnum jensenii TaxID=128206 RepID=A0ABP1B7D4_9BRYO